MEHLGGTEALSSALKPGEESSTFVLFAATTECRRKRALADWNGRGRVVVQTQKSGARESDIYFVIPTVTHWEATGHHQMHR